jgi:hypothetical protein
MAAQTKQRRAGVVGVLVWYAVVCLFGAGWARLAGSEAAAHLPQPATVCVLTSTQH